MAKCGLFGGNAKELMQAYEGDSTHQKDEYVYIYKAKKQVAAIKLADDQSVEEIE